MCLGCARTLSNENLQYLIVCSRLDQVYHLKMYQNWTQIDKQNWVSNSASLSPLSCHWFTTLSTSVIYAAWFDRFIRFVNVSHLIFDLHFSVRLLLKNSTFVRWCTSQINRCLFSHFIFPNQFAVSDSFRLSSFIRQFTVYIISIIT